MAASNSGVNRRAASAVAVVRWHVPAPGATYAVAAVRRYSVGGAGSTEAQPSGARGRAFGACSDLKGGRCSAIQRPVFNLSASLARRQDRSCPWRLFRSHGGSGRDAETFGDNPLKVLRTLRAQRVSPNQAPLIGLAA